MLNFDQFPTTIASPGFTLDFLLHLTLLAVVVIPVVACVDLLLRRRSAAARHHLWLLTLIALCAAPLLSLILPGWSLGPSVAAAAPPPELPLETVPLVDPLFIDENEQAAGHAANQPGMPLETATQPAATPKAVPPATPADLRRVATVTLTLWMSGLAAVFGLGILGQCSLIRTRRASRAVRDAQLLRMRDSVSAQLGLRRQVLLLDNDATTMPVTWGVRRPVLLLPAASADWSEERLRMVLLHELMHVRRFDCLWQWLSLAAVACHWFNPLIWFAARRLRTERERACDDGVLAAGLAASDYAEQLLDISTGGRRNVFAMCTGIAMAQSHRLTGRLRAIVDVNRSRAPLSRQAKAISACALALILVPLTVAARANVESDPSARTEPTETDDSSGGQQRQTQLQQQFEPESEGEPALVLTTVARDSAEDGQAVFEAWRAREQSVGSARFSWTEQRVVQPGGFQSPTDPEILNPEGITFPEEETDYTMRLMLSLDGEMMRYSVDGHHPDHRNNGLVRREYLSVYDGATSKTFQPPSEYRSHPQGAILDEQRNTDISSAAVGPLLMNYRVLNDRMLVRPDRFTGAVFDETVIVVNGHNCRLLRVGPWRYWVDVDRNWLVVRFESKFENRELTQLQVDIDYQEDPRHGWVPSAWTMARFSRSGELRWSFDATVTEYEINPQIPESEFQFEFPAGTLAQDLRNGDQYLVREDGTHRPITRADRGKTYEEIVDSE